jgi:ribosome-associated protein
MPDIPLGRGVSVPEAELDVRAAKAGGPGGQSVNTTDSKIELRWDVAATSALSETQRTRLRERLGSRMTAAGVLILTGSEHKSQHRNREAVLARFRTLVSDALEPPKRRRRTRPTRGSKERRLQAKKQRAEVKKLRKPPQA